LIERGSFFNRQSQQARGLRVNDQVGIVLKLWGQEGGCYKSANFLIERAFNRGQTAFCLMLPMQYEAIHGIRTRSVSSV